VRTSAVSLSLLLWLAPSRCMRLRRDRAICTYIIHQGLENQIVAQG
jgi:hypothetical protein